VLNSSVTSVWVSASLFQCSQDATSATRLNIFPAFSSPQLLPIPNFLIKIAPLEDDALYSNLGNAPDTDAVWVRIPSTTNDYMPIVRYGEDDKGGEDEYEIAVGAQDTSTHEGKIVFRYTTNDEAEETICVSPSRYDDNSWIHVVGVRKSNNDCELYINATLVTGPTSGSSSGAIFIKKLGIGNNWGDEKAGNMFNLVADVASWLHWNNDALSQSEVTELFNTNYGKNATRIHVTINRTDSSGVTQEVLIDHTDFELPFHDPVVNSPANKFYFWSYPNSNSDSWIKSSQYNYTALVSDLAYSTNRTFSIGDRLSFGIKVDSDVQNIPINIQIDDISFPATSLATRSSFLDTPNPTPIWPTFNTFSINNELKVTIINNGPGGIWMTFTGTRLIFTSPDETISYGAMAIEIDDGVNGFEPISSTRDSRYIPDQSVAVVKFNRLTNPPTDPPGPGDSIAAGDYNAFVWLSVYDSGGSTFLRTVDLGLVTVIP